MQVTLLNAAANTVTGATHSKLNTSLITEDLTVQLILTGVPTAVTITIYGSLDGINFDALAIHDAIANGNMFHISGKDVRYIYATATTVTGGTNPTVTANLAY